ncbi:MAG: SEC-C domain-containing protein, partial [Acidobacteriaceae bacterium]|nr:SEC-C domain-containing protein [Acidobacteriaceae bacterium]
MKGAARNTPCPCGSGKKQKKCHADMKPRDSYIVVDCGEPVAMTGVELLHDGEVRWLADDKPVTPAMAWHEVRYDRTKRPKVVNRIPLVPERLLVDPNDALKQFRTIFALDANTREIDGVRVSIGALAAAEIGERKVRCAHLQGFEIHDAVGNPERIIWRVFVSAYAA